MARVVPTCPLIEGYPVLSVRFPDGSVVTACAVDVYNMRTGGTVVTGLTATRVGTTEVYRYDTSALTATLDLEVQEAGIYEFVFRPTAATVTPDSESVVVLANNADHTALMHDGAVWVDPVGGTALPVAGVYTYSYGSIARPVTTLVDAEAVAAARPGLTTIKIRGSVTGVDGTAFAVAAWLRGYMIEGVSADATIQLAAGASCDLHTCEVERCNLQPAFGSITGGFLGRYKSRGETNFNHIYNGSGADALAYFIESTFDFNARLLGGADFCTFDRCTFSNCTLNLAGIGAASRTFFAGCRGTLTIAGMADATSTLVISSGENLRVVFDATCTGGIVQADGLVEIDVSAASGITVTTRPGFTPARVANLDNADVAVSTRLAAVDVGQPTRVVEACPFREGYPTLEARWPTTVTPGTVTVAIYDLNSGTPAVAVASGLATAAGPGTNSFLFDTSSRTGLAGDISPGVYGKWLFKFQGSTASQDIDVIVLANTGRDVAALYGDGVHQNSVTGVALPTPGTFTFGYGSLEQPVITMEDAATCRLALGLPTAYIVLPATFSPASPTTDWAASRIVARGDTSFVPAAAVTVHLNRSQLEGVQLNCFTGGGFSGSYIVRGGRAVGMNLNTSGDQLWDGTQIEGVWTYGAGIWDSTFLRCIFLGAVLNVNNRGSGGTFDFVDIRGTLTIDFLPAGTSVVMSGDNMDITFGSSCGAGCTALITGSGVAQDLSGNVAITFDPVSLQSDVQAVGTAVAGVNTAVLAQNPFIDLAALRNTVSDIHDYDAQGFLLRARTRVFADAATAAAATRVPANAAGLVSVVSSNAADTTQTATVAGLVGGVPTTDVIALNGTTPVAGAVSFDRGTITGITLSAAAAGTVVLSDSGAATLISVGPGATQLGEGEGELFTQTGVGRVDGVHNTLPRDLVVTVA